MKAAHNGVVNFSVLDGWWVEGWVEGVTGWAIGPRQNAGEIFEHGVDGVGVGRACNRLAEKVEVVARQVAKQLANELEAGTVVRPIGRSSPATRAPESSTCSDSMPRWMGSTSPGCGAS
jgi:glucan phosphorylase